MPGAPVLLNTTTETKEEKRFVHKVAGWAAKGAAEEAGKSLVHGLFNSHDDSDEESTEVASSVIKRGISGIAGIFSDD